ncbi:MAG: hypothetical protein DRQ54_02780, partial [Gammaproteobacteria bacterium]
PYEGGSQKASNDQRKVLEPPGHPDLFTHPFGWLNVSAGDQHGEKILQLSIGLRERIDELRINLSGLQEVRRKSLTDSRTVIVGYLSVTIR